MSDHLRLPFNQPVRVRFLDEIPRSRVIHWVQTEGKWKESECEGRDCPRCLAGDRVQQRFTTKVVSGGESMTLDLPIGAWKLISEKLDSMGLQTFFATNFYITKWQHSTSLIVDFELTVAP